MQNLFVLYDSRTYRHENGISVSINYRIIMFFYRLGTIDARMIHARLVSGCVVYDVFLFL